MDNYQEHASATQLKQLGYDRLLPVGPAEEHALNNAGIMTVVQFKALYPEHPFGAVMWEAGLREIMFTPLVNGGKKLGVLSFKARISTLGGPYKNPQRPTGGTVTYVCK